MTIRTQSELAAALLVVPKGATLTIDMDGPPVVRGRRIPVTLTGRVAAPAPLDHSPLVVLRDSSGVTLDGLTIEGAAVGSGYNGHGIVATDCSDITVTGCTLTKLQKGAVFTRVAGLRVTGNDLVTLEEDGLNIVAVSDALIEGNLFSGFCGAGHPDAIQAYSNGQASDCQRVTIRNNAIVGTPDMRPQGVFFSDARHGGHSGVVIDDLLVITPLWHAVSLAACIDVTIRNVRVLNVPGGTYQGGPVKPRVSGRGTVEGVSIADCTQAEADAAVKAWREKYRPKPAPAPAPVEIVPAPEPSPAELIEELGLIIDRASAITAQLRR